ncbi:hypothetical protein K2X33_15025, partial [bacterium]|nr:hypothetical protein [bacterium]
VQTLLGGFVDVNAPDNYKRFLQSPSAALIPQAGAGISQMVSSGSSQPGGSESLGFDESRGARAKSGGATVGKDSIQDPQSGSKSFDVSRGISSTQASSSANGSASSRIEFDDSASGTEADIIGEIKDNGQAGQAGLVDATRDLLSVEGSASAAVSASDKKDSEEADSKLDGNFFKKKKLKKEIRQRRTEVQAVQSTFVALLDKVSNWIIPQAHAEGGGGGDPASVLLGMAALFATISGIAIAAIQAGADKDIAQTNANAQMYMTDRTAQNSERLAQMQSQTALQQSQMSSQVAAANNQGVTDRLNMQLAELRNARQEAASAEQQRMALEQQYNDRRIALAEKQADQTMQIAQATLNAQLTQAGLATGTSVSSSGLATTSSTGSASTGSAITNFGTTTQVAGTTQTGTSTGLGLGLTGTSSVTTARGIASTDDAAALAQPTQAAAGGRLLASLGTSSGRGLTGDVFASVGAEEEADEKDASKPKTVKGRGALAASSVKTVTASSTAETSLLSAVRARPDAALAAGSTRSTASVPSDKGDISNFIGGSAQDPGFAAFQNGAAPAK